MPARKHRPGKYGTNTTPHLTAKERKAYNAKSVYLKAFSAWIDSLTADQFLHYVEHGITVPASQLVSARVAIEQNICIATQEAPLIIKHLSLRESNLRIYPLEERAPVFKPGKPIRPTEGEE